MTRRILLAAALLLLCGTAARFAASPRPVPLRGALEGVPMRVGEWKGTAIAFEADVVGLLGATEYLNRYYERGPEQVDVYVGYYESQGAGRQIHAPRHCLPGSGWSRLGEERGELEIAGAGSVRFVEALYRKDDATRLLVYWYRMKGGGVTSEYALKWRMILNALRYRRNEAAFVRFSTPVDGDAAAAGRLVLEFMRSFVPLLEERLPDDR